MALGAVGAGLLQGGMSLLGGLFNRKDTGKTASQKSIDKENRKVIRRTNRMEVKWNRAVQRRANQVVAGLQKSPVIDTEAFMRDAEKLGYNPVTYLNSGALSLYTGNRNAGYQMEAALVGLQKPGFHYYETPYSGMNQGQTLGETIQGALSAGTNTYLAAQQQIDQNAFQERLVGMQLSALNQGRGTQSRSSFAGVPVMTSTGAVHGSRGSQGEVVISADGTIAGPGPVVKGTVFPTPGGNVIIPPLADLKALEKAGLSSTLADAVQIANAVPDFFAIPANQNWLFNAAGKLNRVVMDAEATARKSWMPNWAQEYFTPPEQPIWKPAWDSFQSGGGPSGRGLQPAYGSSGSNIRRK